LVPVDSHDFVSPVGAKSLDICLIGAPNAGKSSILNWMTERNVSAVSNKYNTTDEAKRGYYTDTNLKT
jgi:GTPase Era involved in 16S rRNA processing